MKEIFRFGVLLLAAAFHAMLIQQFFPSLSLPNAMVFSFFIIMGSQINSLVETITEALINKKDEKK